MPIIRLELRTFKVSCTAINIALAVSRIGCRVPKISIARRIVEEAISAAPREANEAEWLAKCDEKPLGQRKACQAHRTMTNFIQRHSDVTRTTPL